MSQFHTVQASQMAKNNAALTKQLAPELRAKHKPLSQSRYSVGLIKQFQAILTNFTRIYWRSPSYNMSRLVMTVSALEHSG